MYVVGFGANLVWRPYNPSLIYSYCIEKSNRQKCYLMFIPAWIIHTDWNDKINFALPTLQNNEPVPQVVETG